MLARFAFALGSDGVSSQISIEAVDFAAYYESLSAIESGTDRPALNVTDEGGLVATIDTGHDRITLALASSGEPLALNRRLAHAYVSLDEHGLRLGQPGGNFDVGPEVSVRAREIDVVCESLAARSGSEANMGVVLYGKRVQASDAGLKIRTRPSGQRVLEIGSDTPLPYPFSSYPLQTESVASSLGGQEQEAARVLFRLLSHFKSEGYGGLGSYEEPINREAGRLPLLASLLDFAQTKGLITRSGGILQLHPEKVQMNYLQVKASVISPAVAEFLREFVAQL